MAHREDTSGGRREGGSGRDEGLARRRAKVSLIDRVSRQRDVGGDAGANVCAFRLLAEIDLALVEDREQQAASGRRA